MLLAIPSWGELLGYPTLGKYANHYVSKILSDLVLFFTSTEKSVTVRNELSGESTIYFLFGLGYYYTKFELTSGRYITDSRELTGLIISDFVYDSMATSKNVTLDNDPDVIIADKVVKIPLDLSIKSNTQLSFIKGALMRNFFIPYKDIFLEMVSNIKTDDSYQVQKYGHMLLSAEEHSYDNFFVSDRIYDTPYSEYENLTAGIYDVKYSVDELLKHHFSNSELKKIIEALSYLKTIFSNTTYDPMYLFSIIENASNMIPRTQNISGMEKEEKRQKESIFFTAEPRINTFKKWPDQIPINNKTDLEIMARRLESSEKRVQKKFEGVSEEELKKVIEREKVIDENRTDFELRTLKRTKATIRPLPLPPYDNVLNILLYLKRIVEDDYPIKSIGEAFDLARDNIKRIVLHLDYLWDMSKIANMYLREDATLGLSMKEKGELLEKISLWISSTPENLIKRGRPQY